MFGSFCSLVVQHFAMKTMPTHNSILRSALVCPVLTIPWSGEGDGEGGEEDGGEDEYCDTDGLADGRVRLEERHEGTV